MNFGNDFRCNTLLVKAKCQSCVSASGKCKVTFNAKNTSIFFLIHENPFLLRTGSNPLLKIFNKSLFYSTIKKPNTKNLCANVNKIKSL